LTAISDQLRRQIAIRAGHCCEYCHVPIQGQVATFPIDHIIPRTRKGETVLSNLALACPHCNGHKWALVDGVDPSTSQPASLFNPREQVWAEHFAWSAADPVVLEGKTPNGRATIARLLINAPVMITVRRLLLELGIWRD